VHESRFEVLWLRDLVELRHRDDRQRLVVGNARLLPVRRRREHLAACEFLRAEGVQQREHGADRRFPVAAADLQKDDAHLVPAVLARQAVDPPHDRLLPAIELEGLARRAALRVFQQPQELHRPLAVAEGVGNRAVVKYPCRTSHPRPLFRWAGRRRHAHAQRGSTRAPSRAGRSCPVRATSSPEPGAASARPSWSGRKRHPS